LTRNTCRLTRGVIRLTYRPARGAHGSVRPAPVSGMRATSSVVSSLIVAASCCVAGVAPLGADVLPVL